jgi:hypothetical protein
MAGNMVLPAPGRLLILFTLFAALFHSSVSAQFFTFGRNKVQYTDFDWHVMKTEHFDIYYYPEMEDLARSGAFIAEESCRALEQKYNHTILNRIPLIFYSSHLHFEQTNTTPDFIPEGVGGFFEFYKGRVVIPYDGSMSDFRHVIRHELVHVFMYSKISRVLTDHRMLRDHLPPLWFTEGLAEYWSAGWDPQAEMVMRDAVVSGYWTPLGSMDDIIGTFLMYKEGQNLLRFIARKYGEDRILLLMENFWKSGTFEEVFRKTLGVSYKEFDREWGYALRKEYFPLLSTADPPTAASAPLVGDGFNSKPVYYAGQGDTSVYFIGNRNGYTSIYKVSPWKKEARPELVVEGEKTDEFETFHPFQSKLAVSHDGVLAFVTKSGESDALHLYDIPGKKMKDPIHFDNLVVLGSPSFSPDGMSLVFSSVDKAGNNDLYLYDLRSVRLRRLTNDLYDDRDPVWSPDGRSIVFSSDRTTFGERGITNLFTLDTATLMIRYLTWGNWSAAAPEFSPDGRALVFTSDAGGAGNIWMMPVDSLLHPGSAKELTRFTTAAFDPCFADTSSIIFSAFEHFSFQLRILRNPRAAFDTSTVTRAAGDPVTGSPWVPGSIAGSTESRFLKYKGEYSLDVAQSEIATDPVFGTSGGAFLSLSDLLGNEQFNFLVYNTAQSSDELLSSFNIAISRLSLQQRTNYSYGVYRFSGRRYDLTDPDEFFFERSFGGYGAISYPLSKFRRIGLVTSLTNSEKDATSGTTFGPSTVNSDPSRRALFLSNSISFTHDNSLWGPSGPLDGSRFNVTLAYTSDIRNSNASYYSVILDYRQYLRIADRTAYAARFWLFYNDGKEARRFFMGGNWDLRGYDRWSIRGSKLWLTSHELRFPFLDQLSLRFPFGGATFAGIRGAIFFDAGNAWDDRYFETLGSIGAGVRLNLGGAIVLRDDFGKKIEDNFTHIQQSWFNQFFFGWDF